MAFYRTTFTIDVLSEEPLGEWASLEEIAWAIDEGPCVGFKLRAAPVKLTGKQMADALYDAGSNPGFFNLDDDGNPVEGQ